MKVNTCFHIKRHTYMLLLASEGLSEMDVFSNIKGLCRQAWIFRAEETHHIVWMWTNSDLVCMSSLTHHVFSWKIVSCVHWPQACHLCAQGGSTCFSTISKEKKENMLFFSKSHSFGFDHP